jgi:hypothetical protein
MSAASVRAVRSIPVPVVMLLAATVASAAQTGAQAPAPGQAQLPTAITATRFNAGQPIFPYFEGWIRNQDGTFDLVFGYFNRNYQQELAIPAGPDNKVEPSGPDAGQPTYFVTRRQRFIFRVRVPGDFGKKEVVWTITANGRTERGYGTLQPEQEITERVVMTNGNFDPGVDDPNKPPAITVAPVGPVVVDEPVTLTSVVTDDGLPKPRQTASSPAPDKGEAKNRFQAQVNRTDRPPPRALNVRWLQYSGPAKVVFGQAEPLLVSDGKAVTTARFPAPGTYRLVATATDPAPLATTTEVVVTVPERRSSPRQP